MPLFQITRTSERLSDLKVDPATGTAVCSRPENTAGCQNFRLTANKNTLDLEGNGLSLSIQEVSAVPVGNKVCAICPRPRR